MARQGGTACGHATLQEVSRRQGHGVIRRYAILVEQAQPLVIIGRARAVVERHPAQRQRVGRVPKAVHALKGERNATLPIIGTPHAALHVEWQPVHGHMPGGLGPREKASIEVAQHAKIRRRGWYGEVVRVGGPHIEQGGHPLEGDLGVAVELQGFARALPAGVQQ